jgi:hypothetical protein
MERDIRKKVSPAPSISKLARDLEKVSCNHLVGREVIEQQIIDLARGKLDASYCQNWDRCDNGWGKCTPDNKEWMGKIRELKIDKVLTATERKILADLQVSAKIK